MKNKICFITGGTSGIGKDVVHLLAAMGHQVIFTARDAKKGNAIISEVKQATPSAKIIYLTGDLSLVEDVKRIASELQKKVEYLDILINNAGSYTHEKTLTKDGYEQQLMINYYVPRYLCEALLPLLEKSEKGRIVNVTSRMHLKGKTDLSDLNYNQTSYSGFKAYAHTKLLNTAFTNYFASLIKDSNVSAISMHPGVYKTNITQTLPKLVRILWNFFIPPPIKGAENVMHLALNDQSNGTYFNKKKIDKPHSATNDTTFWKQIENLRIG